MSCTIRIRVRIRIQEKKTHLFKGLKNNFLSTKKLAFYKNCKIKWKGKSWKIYTNLLDPEPGGDFMWYGSTRIRIRNTGRKIRRIQYEERKGGTGRYKVEKGDTEYVYSEFSGCKAGIPIKMRRGWHIALTDVGAGCGEGTYTNLPWPEFEKRECL